MRSGLAGARRRWTASVFAALIAAMCSTAGAQVAAPPVDPAAADLPLPAWPPLAPDLALVSLRASADGSGDLVIALQNEGPCRRRFDPGPGWVLLARLDGLDAVAVPDIAQAADAAGAAPAQLSAEGSALVRPWELCFWRLGRR